MWGTFPLYWRLLDLIPAHQTVAWRIVMSALTVGVLIALTDRKLLGRVFRRRRVVALHALSALLISANWLIFMWAVTTDRVLDSSLGYFMNPLVSVLLGTVVLRERLSRAQTIAVAIAAAAVMWLTIEAGVVPFLAMGLASTFALYGLVRKLSPLRSAEGLTVEMTLLLPATVAALAIWAGRGELIVPGDWRFAVLLLAGVVTAGPLLLFASAAQLISLNAVGILQYINPLMQFMIGALIFSEPVGLGRLIGFALIWTALMIFVFDGWQRGAQR